MLIPNERGLERALAHRDRFDEINVFLSASETHNRKNVNRSIAESLAGLEATLATRAAGGPALRGRDLHVVRLPLRGRGPRRSACSRSPSGWPPPGCEEVGFGDTTGMANPRQVHEFFAAAREQLGDAELTAHFHNTRGQGLANALAALEEGSTPSSPRFGELGGCPVPPGSTGNVCTEDLVSMFHEMGIETGIDLEAPAGRLARRAGGAGRPLGSHLLTAGPVDWHR